MAPARLEKAETVMGGWGGRAPHVRLIGYACDLGLHSQLLPAYPVVG